MDPLQLNLSTKHLFVAITIDNLRHPPLSCVTLYKLLALYLYLNSSEQNAYNKAILIRLHKRFASTNQFLSCGDKKSDHNRQ